MKPKPHRAMKAVLITIGVLAIAGVALLVFVLSRAVAVVRTAHGEALYSAVGSWKRMQEFAHAVVQKGHSLAQYNVELRRRMRLRRWLGGFCVGVACLAWAGALGHHFQCE